MLIVKIERDTLIECAKMQVFSVTDYQQSSIKWGKDRLNSVFVLLREELRLKI